MNTWKHLLEYAQHPRWIPRRVAWEWVRRSRTITTVHTDQGLFKVRTGNVILARHLYTRREFESVLMPVAMSILRHEGRSLQQRVLVDVGANIGLTSISLLRSGDAAYAVAIEPVPSNFSDLQANVALNGLTDRTACYQFAASVERGTLTMELSRVNVGDHRILANTTSPALFGESGRETVSVGAEKLDAFIPSLPSAVRNALGCLWIDVQGYDAMVLRGSAETIAQHQLPVCTEFWPYGILRAGETEQSYCALIARLFRRMYVIDDGEVSGPIAPDSLPSLFQQLSAGTADRTLVLFP